MSDYFHENAVRKMLEPKERDIPCKECFIFKIEEERVNQFIANYKAGISLRPMIPLSVIEEIKAKIEALDIEDVCAKEHGCHTEVIEIIDEVVKEYIHE